jgi:Na+/H+ antiporter NhaD/arsenite permease-like protein
MPLTSVPPEFGLFALTLLGVALFHRHTLPIALAGLGAVVLYKLVGPGFATGPGVNGLMEHLGHEWPTLANLLCLLTAFAVLARHFELSNLPLLLARWLPDDWTGGLWLLAIVLVMSSFLDNIAAALIGGAMAHSLFRGRVHVGYLAALVAAANAGGSGSVVGDTTTTRIWIAGHSPTEVLHAYVAAVAAFIVFGVPAARQQHRHSPIVKNPHKGTHVSWPRLLIVAWVLVCALGANVAVNLRAPELADRFPVIGSAALAAMIVSIPLRQPDWRVLPATLRSSLFLLSLVTAASLMPVDRLPPPSWPSSLGLGFVSAVFDNIPLTALALRQGGYDWGVLAYAVGFGGSMIWFGSSAGVALSALYPEAKSTQAWLRHGWHVAAAYVLGFAALLLLLGWHPDV